MGFSLFNPRECVKKTRGSEKVSDFFLQFDTQKVVKYITKRSKEIRNNRHSLRAMLHGTAPVFQRFLEPLLIS
jgi:hypothetical protein